MPRLSFPDGFLWGVATSAQQIEGGQEDSGRGESIWDRFASTPGRIADGSDSRIACDHYHRWRGDIDLMRRLGVGAYRFSIAWPRIQPRGRGAAHAAGLDFYDALVDGLVAADIRPFVTLFHWDLPQALQDKGGWAERDTAAAFADYVEIVSARLGDRVSHWATHNEPWCVSTLGYAEGRHAPGLTDPPAGLRVAHHLLVSHGLAVEVLRQTAPRSEIGIVLNLMPVMPAASAAADAEAARRLDGTFNRWFLDPLFGRGYPPDVIADRVSCGHLASSDLPFVHPGDLPAIAAPLDFLGVNYYSRAVVRAGAAGAPVPVPTVPPEELTDMGWEVFPSGLTDLLVRLEREYRPPRIYLTENGVAYGDGPDAAGRIADRRRVAFLRDHLVAAHGALAGGVPLRGYFAWSLLDNFEWADGYTKRFGLYWVNFSTQERLPKDSAFWYRNVVDANAVGDEVAIPLRRATRGG